MKKMKALALFLVFFLFLCFVTAAAYAQGMEQATHIYRIYQIWNDAGNMDGLRPESVPITVITQSGTFTVTTSDPFEVEGPVSFIQPPLEHGYIGEGPCITTEGNQSAVVFINTHIPSTSRSIANTLEVGVGALAIEKIAEEAGTDEVFWFDVTLDADREYRYITSRGAGGDVAGGIPLHAGEIATISGIPVGTPYVVKERDDPRYLSTGENVEGTIRQDMTVVTFTNELITTIFTVYKEWEGTDRSPISLHLYADGAEVEADFVQVGNMYTVYDLPKYALDGHEILYSAKEDYMDGYMTMYVNKGKYANRSKAVYPGGTIINREVATFFIHKKWIGTENPPEIRFQLYQNGIPIEWRQPEMLAGGIYLWRNLPRMKDGEEAVYSAAELPVPGYLTRYENPRSSVDDRALYGGTVVNYRLPVTRDQENPALWRIVGVLSLIVLAGSLAWRKRE